MYNSTVGCATNNVLKLLLYLVSFPYPARGVGLGTGNETDFVTCKVWNVIC